jgi:hypothetical protein
VVKLLAKANDDVLSHCQCATALASIPDQLDCPWCGCGWLITCTQCRRAFTYASVVDVETDYETYVQEDRRRGGHDDFDAAELRACAAGLQEALADVPVGTTVVYLDGLYFGVDEAPGAFDGLFAAHDLQRLPHFAALTEPAQLRATLGDPSYWLERELPEASGPH